jgi:hypothetical protein
MLNRCAFWIQGGGERYYHEALNSAGELKKHMPDIDRFMFSTLERRHDLFKGCALLPQPKGEYWYLDSIVYFNIAYDMLCRKGYDQILYLDTDTNFLAPFPELFEMAQWFDVVGVMGSRRVTGATFKPVPLPFPEFEIGVTIFAHNNLVRKLLEHWQKLHWANPDVYGNNDQRSFREALWDFLPEIRIGTAPPEYGCRWPFGTFVSLPVKILHGRPGDDKGPDVQFVKDHINEHLDMRVWTPRSHYWREGVQPPNYEGS